MNTYLLTQVNSIKGMVHTFEQACELAVFKDDGKLSKEEAKAIKLIKKANENYLKELAHIKLD